ncbi:hypothetical protein PROFUN_09494 [Planoprotostelium fungivorum]|uniref:Uncharacterized protein n=1 Tax=Planoprotostelium fungivorum TaxID=1890364 RepID=A0A2P6NH78_9EUKA|nr:hypothetical protein PROFUN_09494 [Planoprotostelium fungivorum]
MWTSSTCIHDPLSSVFLPVSLLTLCSLSPLTGRIGVTGLRMKEGTELTDEQRSEGTHERNESPPGTRATELEQQVRT